jgi:hypothetical protein
MRSADSSASPIDSKRLLPTSIAIVAASSNFRSRMSPAARCMTATRSCHGNLAQSRCARRADVMAASTCSRVADANAPSTMRVSIGDVSENVGRSGWIATSSMYSG